MATRSESFLATRILRALLPYGLILVTTAAFTIASRMSHERRNRDLQAREVRLTGEIADLKEEVHQLGDRLQGIQYDPYVVERRIRQRLGYVRPGELVIRPESPTTRPRR